MRRKAGAQALAFGTCVLAVGCATAVLVLACRPSGSWVRSWDTVDDVHAVYRGYVLVLRYAGVLSRYTVPTGSSVLCPLVLNEGW